MTSTSSAPLIPPNMIAYISDYMFYPYAHFALMKGSHILVVQVPCITNRDLSSYIDNKEAGEKLDRSYMESLEVIQSLIDTIEFEKTAWAYLTQKSGNYKLVQRMKKLPSFMDPLLAPFIEESEITIKRFIMGRAQLRVGEWKGQEVDVFRMWDPRSCYEIHTLFENFQALERLDITFKVLGNLVDADGTIVGLVTEPHIGREIRLEDRSVVYKAVAKLQEHGYLFTRVLDSMIISDGKVRLINMFNEFVSYYEPEERHDLEEHAKLYHWEFLRKLFARQLHTHWPEIRSYTAPYKILPRIPSPERPLRVQIYHRILTPSAKPRSRRTGKLKTIGGANTMKSITSTNIDNFMAISKRAKLPVPLLCNTVGS